MKEVTAIFFSYRRMDLLHRTIKSFLAMNTYPIKEMILVDDSADAEIHKEITDKYPDYHLILHPENMGLIKSMDVGYSQIKTEYIFHCEDDWEFYRPSFIESSFDVLRARDNVLTVWLREKWDMNGHPVEARIHHAFDTQYQFIQTNWNGWHGYTFNPGLRRLKDYEAIKPFASFLGKERDSVFAEQRIGEAYKKLGFCGATLLHGHVRHIGRGRTTRIRGK